MNRPNSLTFAIRRFIRHLIFLGAALPMVGLRAELASLAVSDGTLDPAFVSSETNYDASVPFRTTQVSVIPVEAGPGSTIQVRVNSGSWVPVVSASASSPLALSVGTNAIEVEVTAGSLVTTYGIEVTRAAEADDPVYRYDFNSDGVLPNLTIYNNTGQPVSNFYTVSGGELHQNTSTVNGNVSFLFPDASSNGGGFSQAKATYAEARLKITSAAGNSGIYFAIYDGGKSYTANFSATGVTVGSTFVPLADIGQYHTYRLESPPNSSILYLFRDDILTLVTTADSAPYNGFGWGDGTSSGGNHGVVDWDYIEFGQLSSYNPVFNGSVQGLDLSGGSLSPVFAEDVLVYEASVSSQTQDIGLTVISGAQTLVNLTGMELSSGVPSNNIALGFGRNILIVTATGPNGVSKEYTVIVTRAPDSPPLSGTLIGADAVFAHDFENLSGDVLQPMTGPSVMLPSSVRRATHAGALPSGLGFSPVHLMAPAEGFHPPIDTLSRLSSPAERLAFSIQYNDKGYDHFNNTYGNRTALLSTYRGTGEFLPGELSFDIVSGDTDWYQARLRLAIGPSVFKSPGIIPFGDASWHQAGFVFDQGEVQFYFDGLPLGAPMRAAGVTSIPAQMENWRLLEDTSSVSNPDEYFPAGLYDEAALWTRALSGEEMQGLFRAGIRSVAAPPSGVVSPPKDYQTFGLVQGFGAPKPYGKPWFWDSGTFGTGVAIAGKFMVVGAPVDDSAGALNGALFVYDLNSASPGEPFLTIPNPTPGFRSAFGWKISSSGTRIAVTSGDRVLVFDLAGPTPSIPAYNLGPVSASAIAFQWPLLAVGSSSAGQTQIYNLEGATPGTPIHILSHPSPEVSDLFGRCVALHGRKLAVGAAKPGAGAVFVYDLDAAIPTAVLHTFVSPMAGSTFGNALAMNDQFLAVGNPYAAGSWGTVCLYRLDDADATRPRAILTDANQWVLAATYFGATLAIDGDTLAVMSGETNERRPSVLLYDLSASDIRTPYVRLSQPTSETQTSFGASVALGGGRVLVGSTFDSRVHYRAGAAYLYGAEPFPLVERELLVGGWSDGENMQGWSPLPGFTGLRSVGSGSVPSTGLPSNQSLGSDIFMSSPSSLSPAGNPQQSFQDIDLSRGAESIETGLQRFHFSALLQGSIESGITSRAEIDLIFRNAAGEVLQQSFFEDSDLIVPDWEEVEEFGFVPKGTRSVRVILRTSRSSGVYHLQSSAFDNISFVLTRSDILRRVDLDARTHTTSGPGYQITLDPGRYRIRPVPRSRFTAWHGWGGVSNNDAGGDTSGDRFLQGWQWSYVLKLPSRSDQLVRASIAGYFREADRAFQKNSTSHEFILRETGIVKLSIPDNTPSNNAGGLSLAIERLADQDETFAHTVGPVSYRTAADSPFRSVAFGPGDWAIQPSITSSIGGIGITPSPDGSFVRFEFDRATLGYLPTHAGVVWAGSQSPAGVTVEFFNKDGLLVATLGPARVAADHFFGAVYRGGIASFTVSAPGGNVVLRDLQYGLAGDGGQVSFAGETGVSKAGRIHAAVPLPSGGLLVAGAFAEVNGEARPGLARFESAGGLHSWSPSAAAVPNNIHTIAVHGNRVFVGGSGGVPLAYVALEDASAVTALPLVGEVVSLVVVGDSLFVAQPDRVRRFDIMPEAITEADWSSLPEWIGAGGGPIKALAASGGGLLVGGGFSSLQGVARNGLAKIDTNGLSDPAWLPDLGSNPFEVAQLLPGAGGFHVLGTGGEVRRLFDAGGADPAWNALVDPTVSSIAPASSGIFLGGHDGAIRTYQGSGSPIPALTTNGPVHFLHPEGTVLHGFGSFNVAGPVDALGWVKLDGDDTVPGPSIALPGKILCMARQPDGKLLIGGDFQWVEGMAVHGLARLLGGTDRLDPVWRPVLEGGPVRAIAIAGDEIFVGGDFTVADGLACSLAKYELFADSGPDAAWNPPVDNVTAIATSRDHIFVAGDFGDPGLRRIARNGGVMDPTWGPVMANQNGDVEILTLSLHGEHLYLGGRFTSVAPGITRSGLARLALTTGTADSWNPNLFVSENEAPEVRALHFLGDLLHIAGNFTIIQGTVQPNLARMSVEGLFAGAVDSSWTPMINEPICSMMAIGENLFVAGNDIFTVKMNVASAVARQLETADGPIHALSFDNGRIIAGGAFVNFGGERAPAFAATPYLGSPRVTFRDGRLYIYPDDGTGPFIGSFEITDLSGGILLDPDTLQAVTGTVSVELGAKGLIWEPAEEGVAPSVTVVALPPSGLSSPDLNPVTTDLSVNPATPQFRFDRTDMQVFEGDLFNGFVNFTGTVAQLGTVAYEIMPGTARRFDGTIGDYVNVIQPLRFEWNPQGGVFQAPLRIPVLEDGIVEGAEEFYIRLVQPSSGLALGPGNLLRVRIIDGARASGTGAPASVLDPLRTAAPNPVMPLATGSVRVNLPPPVAGGTWRLWGDAFWRDSMSVAGNLQNNIFHHIDYRPAAGYAELLNSRQYVQAGTQAQIVRTYETIDPGFPVADGSLQVLFSPPSVTAGAQWRLVGGNDWHDSGEVMALPPGNHLIEFRNDVVGWTPPAPRPVGIATGQPLVVRASYIPVRSPGNPLAPVSFTGVDPATSAPYQCVGQIETNFGFATGTAVSEQTVLTAARVLWNPDTLTVASRAAWLHQKDPVHYRPAPRNPRGVFILSGYAQRLATDARNGIGTNSTGNLPSDNLDVAVAYFAGTTVARDGYSGFLADYSPVSGFNPWLLGTAPKRLVGYPMVGVANPGAMHSASFAVAMQPVQNQVFASPEVGGLPGMEGSPLFSFHPGRNRYYPAAIYLGENDGARFRALDGNVAELIYRAEYIAAILNYNGGTGGGDEFQNNLSEDDFPIGFVQVEIPLGIGRWRIIDGAGNPVTVWFEGGESAPVIPGVWRVQFEQVAGLATPEPETVVVQSSLFAPVITGNYPLTAEVWAAGYFNESELADDSVSGPSADPDNDGIANLLEFAFGLAPEIGRRSEYVAGSEIPGMPLVTLDRGTPIPVLRVEFLRRKASFAPELDYIVEFADSPAGGWSRALPETITVEELIEDPTWERVIAHVPTGSEGKQFTRVRVDLIPRVTIPAP